MGSWGDGTNTGLERLSRIGVQPTKTYRPEFCKLKKYNPETQKVGGGIYPRLQNTVIFRHKILLSPNMLPSPEER